MKKVILWSGLLLMNFGGVLLYGVEKPWFSGSLVSPPGEVLEYGSFKIRSYLYLGTYTSNYRENWRPICKNHDLFSTQLELQGYFGLTPWCDFEMNPRFCLNASHGRCYFFPADLKLGLGFQLIDPNLTPYFPGLKFTVKEIFPTGSFQNLRPIQRSADAIGNGAYGTELGLVLYKYWLLHSSRWLTFTFSSLYTLNQPFHVRGFNSFGGGFGTDGKVLPGSQWETDCSFELSLGLKWALALDVVYVYNSHTQFFGDTGIGVNGRYATVGGSFADQISLAPAIEYQCNSSLALTLGSWFSIGGRNSTPFASGLIDFEFVY